VVSDSSETVEIGYLLTSVRYWVEVEWMVVVTTEAVDPEPRV